MRKRAPLTASQRYLAAYDWRFDYHFERQIGIVPTEVGQVGFPLRSTAALQPAGLGGCLPERSGRGYGIPRKICESGQIPVRSLYGDQEV